ncbi:MAG: hypothetical protein ABFD45_03615 [Smithella sp.]
MKVTEIVHYLNFLVKQYDGITQLIAKTKQRICSLPGQEDDTTCDTSLKGDGKSEGLLTVQGRYSRAIEKELPQWDVWEQWLKLVPGIGAWSAAKLIIFFNYKFVPVCKDCGGMLEKKESLSRGKTINILKCTDCGKTAKDGLLKHKIEIRDFSTISKWWAYMGRHTIDGIMPKRKKGVLSNWSNEGRTLGFLIGEQFNRQPEDNPYKKFLLERKAKHARNHPDWSKGHIHNAAMNETIKLFLSHFWVVSRQLEGKPVSEPYAGALMGHTNIIKPFFWNEAK